VEESATATGGELVLVATPIGNLGDLSRRAREVLASADALYCEDTRRTRVLLAAEGIAAGRRLHALHAHNEAERAGEVAERVARGETVALVTDAGTPGISDPGARVVAVLAREGLRVTTVPGPASVIAALVVSGLDTARFVVEGFIPRRGAERAAVLDQWASERRTIVALESPTRLAATLEDLAGRFPARRAAVVRELTKVHEEVVRGTLAQLAARFAETEARGEVVLVLEGAEVVAPDADAVTARVASHLSEGMSVRDAAAAVASELGVAHRDAYDAALRARTGREA
jgi:16S rRNA (cytidine1402-2'-O)-methyltransferase